jgi:TonB family protein
MTAWTSQPELPWSQVREEDQRFHRILGISLACSLALGAVAPNIPLPLRVTAEPPDMPARRVRLLEEPARTVPEPAAVIAAPPEPEPKAVPQPVAEPKASRPPVAGTGVLAMRGALASLQERSPRNAAEPVRPQPETGPGVNQASLLTEGITDPGAHIQLGVAREEMLGSTELPADAGGGPLPLEPGSESLAGAPASALSSGLRTEEGIQEVLDRHKGEMFNLYNRALRSDPDLRGDLVLRLSIDASGVVTHCSVISSNLGAVALERDLVALVRGISFGSVPGASKVTTRVPIEFFPQ